MSFVYNNDEIRIITDEPITGATDLAELIIKRLDLGPTHFIGHSYGEVSSKKFSMLDVTHYDYNQEGTLNSRQSSLSHCCCSQYRCTNYRTTCYRKMVVIFDFSLIPIPKERKNKIIDDTPNNIPR